MVRRKKNPFSRIEHIQRSLKKWTSRLNAKMRHQGSDSVKVQVPQILREQFDGLQYVLYREDGTFTGFETKKSLRQKQKV